MTTVKFVVEITKNPNKQVDAFDAKIETILPEIEVEKPFKTVNMFNNKNFENVFYNLAINEKFIEQNAWWFNVSSDKREDKEISDFDRMSEVEQELVSFKMPLDFDIIKLQKFTENNDDFLKLSLNERSDISEQLELMQKLQSVLQRRYNRLAAKSYDVLDNVEIPEVLPEDITDYDNKIGFGFVSTSYSNKNEITSPVINDDGSNDKICPDSKK